MGLKAKKKQMDDENNTDKQNNDSSITPAKLIYDDELQLYTIDTVPIIRRRLANLNHRQVR